HVRGAVRAARCDRGHHRTLPDPVRLSAAHAARASVDLACLPPSRPGRARARSGAVRSVRANRGGVTVADTIDIVAAVIRDEAGRILLVRKRGTTTFMQPGGKRDPGEDDIATLSREIDEELGCQLVPGSIRPLGEFDAISANE